jgi:non-homologous end joining protein Ku
VRPHRDETDHGNVIDLMAALKRSLGEEPGTAVKKKTPPRMGASEEAAPKKGSGRSARRMRT